MIIGFKCPFLNKYVSFEQCYKCRHRTEKCISKYFIELMIKKKSQSWNVIYPSTELGCPRKTILDRVVHNYIDYKVIKKILDGIAYHNLMEEKDKDKDFLDIETNVRMNIDEYEIHGRIDGFDYNTKILYDWKFTATLKYVPYEKHLYQIALYDYILRNNNDMEIEKAELRYINYYDLSEKDIVLNREDLNELGEEAMKKVFILADALDKAKNGILVNGIQGDECKWCPFKFVCDAGNDLEKISNIIKKSRELDLIPDEEIVLD